LFGSLFALLSQASSLEASDCVTSRIVIIAGYVSQDDPLNYAISNLTQLAAQTLGNGKSSDDDVILLSGFEETPSCVEKELAKCSGCKSLFVYLIGHGDQMSGEAVFRFSHDATITVAQMSGWMRRLSPSQKMSVTVVMDFCHSGFFASQVSNALDGRGTVIASCGADEIAYFLDDGMVSYSEFFFSALMSGWNARQAHELARRSMQACQHASAVFNVGEHSGEEPPYARSDAHAADYPPPFMLVVPSFFMGSDSTNDFLKLHQALSACGMAPSETPQREVLFGFPLAPEVIENPSL